MDQKGETNPETNHHTNPADYPRGRGYGHDYMRGGEIHGGYGYSSREEYRRPRGEIGSGTPTLTTTDENSIDSDLEQPLDASTDVAAHAADSANSADPDGKGDFQAASRFEHVFGASGAAPHSRSYYVTQAQLQQRLYGQRG